MLTAWLPVLTAFLPFQLTDIPLSIGQGIVATQSSAARCRTARRALLMESGGADGSMASGAVDLSGDGGCWKRTLRSPLPHAKKVDVGSVAAVHFTASLSDGSLLRDSRTDAPLEIRVGAEPSDAVLAWDLALPNMSVGEVVQLICQPNYAYGDAGAPPLIPPNADMVFELEVVSVRNLRDSHNPEEVDFLAKYNELVERRAQRKQSTRNLDTPPVAKTDDLPLAKTVPEERASLEQPAMGERLPEERSSGSEARVSGKPTGQAWVPERVEIHGEHPSGYFWRENDEWMEVTFTLPPEALKTNVECSIKRASIRLSYGSEKPLLDGELAGRVDIDGSTWSFESGDASDASPAVVLTFAKQERGLWGYVLLEERIQAQKDAGEPLKDGPMDGSEPMASSLQRPGVDWG